MVGIFLLGLGLFAVGSSVRALMEGEIRAVWSTLGGWGTLSSSFSRDEHPIPFWAATLFYGIAGLLLGAFGVVRLLTL